MRNRKSKHSNSGLEGIRVLLTDGSYKHTLGAVRYLAMEGAQVEVMGKSTSCAAFSRFAKRCVYPATRFGHERINRFANFLERSRYHVILPIGADSVWLISTHRDKLAAYTNFALPSKEALDITLDTVATGIIADKVGITCPKTVVLESQHSMPSGLNRFGRVVLKRANELHPGNPVYVDKMQDLLEQIERWQAKNRAFPLVQQYIHGVGEGFFALYDHGVCKRIFMHRRIRENPPSGGASCCAESIFEQDLLQAGRRILDALSWHGVAMVEFKRELNSGKLYLMEVNPKFWGSLDLALASGVNFPALAVKTALGEDVGYSDSYRVGLRFHWPFDGGEIRHLLRNPFSLFAIVKDCLNPAVKSNLWAFDVLPGLVSFLSASKEPFMCLKELISKYRFHVSSERHNSISLPRSQSRLV